MNNSETGVQKFKDGYNCAQAVFFSLRKYTGLSEDLSLKIATGFGGGMGRTQNVCGAVSGGILALNAVLGRNAGEGKEKNEDTYLKTRKLIEKFEKRKKTIICRELLDGCNLLTDEGQERFSAENMAEICHSCIAAVIEIVEEILEEA